MKEGGVETAIEGEGGKEQKSTHFIVDLIQH